MEAYRKCINADDRLARILTPHPQLQVCGSLELPVSELEIDWATWHWKDREILRVIHTTRVNWELLMKWVPRAKPTESTSANDVQRWLLIVGMVIRDTYLCMETESGSDGEVPYGGAQFLKHSCATRDDLKTYVWPAITAAYHPPVGGPDIESNLVEPPVVAKDSHTPSGSKPRPAASSAPSNKPSGRPKGASRSRTVAGPSNAATAASSSRVAPSSAQPVASSSRVAPSAAQAAASSSRPAPSAAQAVASSSRPAPSTAQAAASSSRPAPSSAQAAASTSRPAPSSAQPVVKARRPAPDTSGPAAGDPR